MKYKYYKLIFALLTLMMLVSCGSTPGSPGSDSGKTGVIIDATIVPKAGGSAGLAGFNVDSLQDVCPDGTLEPFFDQTATVTINVRLLTPDSTVPVGKLYIEKYTVEFRRSDDSTGAPPILQDTRFQTITILPPSGTGLTTVIQDVMMIDIPRKIQYDTDMLSGAYSSAIGNTAPAILNNYTAIYTFEGQNDFGEHFTFQTHMGFSIGDFNNCGG